MAKTIDLKKYPSLEDKLSYIESTLNKVFQSSLIANKSLLVVPVHLPIHAKLLEANEPIGVMVGIPGRILGGVLTFKGSGKEVEISLSYVGNFGRLSMSMKSKPKLLQIKAPSDYSMVSGDQLFVSFSEAVQDVYGVLLVLPDLNNAAKSKIVVEEVLALLEEATANEGT